MNVLVAMPLHKIIPGVIEMVTQQRYTMGRFDLLVMGTGYPDVIGDKGKVNTVAKQEYARQQALSNDYDALVFVEDDHMLLNNAYLSRIINTMQNSGAGVVYAPYRFRYGPQRCSITTVMSTNLYMMHADQHPLYNHWLAHQSVIQCEGLGFGFTAIHRNVLERIPFRNQTAAELQHWRSDVHSDCCFAMDCKEDDIYAVADFGLRVGHWAGNAQGWLYP